MRRAAHAILSMGPRAVLVKGGHLEGPSAADLFADEAGETWIEAERVQTANTHGTGCTLSAAITAYLARGEPLVDAVQRGKAFVTDAIRHPVAIGHGIGPVNPGWRAMAAETAGGPEASEEAGRAGSEEGDPVSRRAGRVRP
jgi:hydroxymethylpyrimidine/phosphomethylpyrimidine kinase